MSANHGVLLHRRCQPDLSDSFFLFGARGTGKTTLLKELLGHHSVRKRLGKSPKFFFFDLGVARALAGHLRIPVLEGTPPFGALFEQFVILEMFRLNQYHSLDFELAHLRTKEQAEVDLIIRRPGKPYALCEIKSSRHVDVADLQFVQSLARDFGEPVDCYCLCREERPRRHQGVHILNWKDGIREICQ